jgi:hypothetical protein
MPPKIPLVFGATQDIVAQRRPVTQDRHFPTDWAEDIAGRSNPPDRQKISENPGGLSQSGGLRPEMGQSYFQKYFKGEAVSWDFTV